MQGLRKWAGWVILIGGACVWGDAAPAAFALDAAAAVVGVMRAVREGRIEAAYAESRALVKAKPKSSAILLLHGRVAAQFGRYDEAIQAFQLASEVDPALSREVRKQIALTLARSGAIQKAFDMGLGSGASPPDVSTRALVAAAMAGILKRASLPSYSRQSVLNDLENLSARADSGLARTYAAGLHVDNGDYASARRELEAALASLDPEFTASDRAQAARLLEQVMGILDSESRSFRRWALEGQALLGYHSNVSGIAESGVTEGNAVAYFEGAAAWNAVEKDSFGSRLQYVVQVEETVSRPSFRYTQNLLNFENVYRSEKWQFRFRPYVLLEALARVFFHFGGGAEIGVRRWLGLFYLGGDAGSFRGLSTDRRFTYLSGWTHQAEWVVGYASRAGYFEMGYSRFLANIGDLSLGGGATLPTAYAENAAVLRAGLDFSARARLSLGYRLGFRDYPSVAVPGASKREDRLQTLSLSFARVLSERWTLLANVGGQSNRSSLGVGSVADKNYSLAYGNLGVRWEM